MKCAALLLLLACALLQADALKCRKSACTGTGPCSTSIMTCSGDATQCFFMIIVTPIFTMTRGCIKPSDCQILQSFEPSTDCCSTDLCN